MPLRWVQLLERILLIFLPVALISAWLMRLMRLIRDYLRWALKSRLNRWQILPPLKVGIAHGMYADRNTALQALAVIGQEPVWIFSGNNGPTSLALALALALTQDRLLKLRSR